MLPVEILRKQQQETLTQIQLRWQKLELIKPLFEFYSVKSDKDIFDEFEKLDRLRKALWYINPDTSPRICHEDYMIDQDILEKNLFRDIRNIAFAYNSLSHNYNASTIFINQYHFIALQEPAHDQVSLFYKLLLNHHVTGLVRLKPEHEFVDNRSSKYWLEKLERHNDRLNHKISIAGDPLTQPIFIPYIYSEKWTDDQDVEIEELHTLVKGVRNIFRVKGGPIAIHCASGVGRTGTLMAAVAIAEFLDKSELNDLSIEKMVLYLSLQRPNMVGVASQYLLLYRFAAYYKNRRNSKL